MSEEQVADVTIRPPAPSFEGVAALMLVVGVPRDRIGEVWEAMKWMSVATSPVEADQVVRAAFDLVKRGVPGPTRPEAGLTDDHEQIIKQIEDASKEADGKK